MVIARGCARGTQLLFAFSVGVPGYGYSVPGKRAHIREVAPLPCERPFSLGKPMNERRWEIYV